MFRSSQNFTVFCLTSDCYTVFGFTIVPRFATENIIAFFLDVYLNFYLAVSGGSNLRICLHNNYFSQSTIRHD